MRERPILFNGAMVRAILAGQKTQTRRVVTLPHQNPLGQWEASTSGGYGARDRKGNLVPEHVCIWHTRTGDTLSCPLGEPGDRLWVRETWQHYDWSEDGEPCIRYQADGATEWPEDYSEEEGQRLGDVWVALSAEENFAIDGRAADRRWRPSIHMPRWASRLALEITAVRVERLQDISEGDAAAEGACVNVLPDIRLPRSHPRAALPMIYADDREIFADLWDSTGGGWDGNPWVWVIEFKRVEAA